jgi:hypothetical protein
MLVYMYKGILVGPIHQAMGYPQPAAGDYGARNSCTHSLRAAMRKRENAPCA